MPAHGGRSTQPPPPAPRAGSMMPAHEGRSPGPPRTGSAGHPGCSDGGQPQQADYDVFDDFDAAPVRLGHGMRDFVYYKKRCGRDIATREAFEFEEQTEEMIANNEREKKIRFVLSREQPTTNQVTITPLKRPRGARTRDVPSSNEPSAEEPIDAYKDWLAELQQDEPNIEFKDDYRDETIKTYTEWLRRKGYLPPILSYLEHNDSDDEPLLDEESLDSTLTPPTNWPSHARRKKNKRQGHYSQGRNKRGRGTLKGLAAAIKRIKSGSQKLPIEFATRLGGPTGSNTSSDVLNRWDMQDTEDERKKIWTIANERYKGWRSTLSATSKAYNSYAERMKNKPEDLDFVEWHYLLLYFASDSIQNVSSRNSEIREQVKTKHCAGSKPFSRISYEQRDPHTGEEPNDLDLWLNTHSKNGQWSDEASKAVYDNATELIALRETNSSEGSVLPREEENSLFQKSYKESTGCKRHKPHGHGYLSKTPTQSQQLNAQIQEQARATAASNQRNTELQGEVQDLKDQLAEKERMFQEKFEALQEEESRKREALKEELLAAIADRRQHTLPQANPQNIAPSDIAATPALQNNGQKNRGSTLTQSLLQNNTANGSGTFIPPQQLLNAAIKRVRTRSQQDLKLGLGVKLCSGRKDLCNVQQALPKAI